MLIEYFNIEPYKEKIKKIITKSGDVIEVPMEVANDFPTLAGFACKIKVHRDTMQEWCKEHQDFSVAYKKASQFQEHFLATNGLKNLIHPNFAIFTAKNVIGWRDKQPGEEDKVIVNNFTNMTDEEIDRKLAELESDK